jgi:hypothetical protein
VETIKKSNKMKIYFYLDVVLTNYDTLEPMPSGNVFSVEFSKFSETKRLFKFLNIDDCKLAEKRLIELNLKYKKTYSVEFENDNEFKEHPCFFLALPTEQNLINSNEDTVTVNVKKMSKKEIAIDLTENIIILSKKAKEFFEKEIDFIKIEEIIDISEKKIFYKISTLPVLEIPIVFKKVKEVIHSFQEKTSDKFIVTDSDGRISLSKKGIATIHKNKLMLSNTFEYDNKKYEDAVFRLIVSGDFASRILNVLGGEQQGIYLTPLSLDLI